MKGAALLYVGQFIESMCSAQWKLLQNQVSQREAETVLESYRALQPKVTYSIKNYHFEMREVKTKKTIKADSEAKQLRKE